MRKLAFGAKFSVLETFLAEAVQEAEGDDYADCDYGRADDGPGVGAVAGAAGDVGRGGGAGVVGA